MPYDTAPPKAVQLACSVPEIVAVLESAAAQGLVQPEDRPVLDDLKARALFGAATPAEGQTALNRALAAGPAADRALDAIAPLFLSCDVVEIRSLDPAGGGSVSTYGRLSVPEERARLAEAIAAANGVRNVYFSANPRKPDLLGATRAASEADVAARRTVFADLDDKDAPPTDAGWTRTLAELEALGPVLTLRTGNGWHVYLSTDAVEGEDVAASAGPLAAALARLGSDNVSDAPRIMRLPLTVNLPTAAKRRRGAAPKLAVPEPLAVQPVAARPLAAVCRDLESIAQRLGLSGKGGALATAGTSRVAAGGGVKTGWAAPSADLLRQALAELPNQLGGAFDDRDEWQRLGHAAKGAAIAGGIEAEGRAAFVEWSLQWGGDPEAIGQFWDSIASPHTGWGRVMQVLEAVNPEGADRVKAAVARAAFAQAAADTRAAILAAPFAPVAPIAASQLAPRRWLYGRSAIAGFLSFLVAPGGAGKSALALAEAVATASGKELLAGEAPVRPLRVWMHNAEDDLPEMQRRLAATLQHFGLTYADLNDNLFMTSGRDLKLQLARTGKNGPEIVAGVVDALVERAVSAKLDVIVLDPLGALHTLPENSNEAANLLSGALREIAHRADVAVIVLHHTGKAAATDMDAAGAGASRGASAFVDAARVVRQVVRMSDREAARYGIAEADRRDYLRIENGKANLARAEGGRWLRMVDVGLGNGMGLWPLGDRVGVVERWTPPQALSGTASDLQSVQAAIAAAPNPPRVSPKSPDWAGYIVAAALGLKVGQHGVPLKDRTADEMAALTRVRGLLDGWLRDGGLVRLRARDPKARHEVEVVGIGRPAMLSEDGETPDTDSDQ